MTNVQVDWWARRNTRPELQARILPVMATEAPEVHELLAAIEHLIEAVRRQMMPTERLPARASLSAGEALVQIGSLAVAWNPMAFFFAHENALQASLESLALALDFSGPLGHRFNRRYHLFLASRDRPHPQDSTPTPRDPQEPR